MLFIFIPKIGWLFWLELNGALSPVQTAGATMSIVEQKKQCDESQIERFLFIDRVTELLGIAPRTVRLWVRERRFPEPDGNVGGRNFWLESSLLQWQAEAIGGRFSTERRGWLPGREEGRVPAGKSTAGVA